MREYDGRGLIQHGGSVRRAVFKTAQLEWVCTGNRSTATGHTMQEYILPNLRQRMLPNGAKWQAGCLEAKQEQEGGRTYRLD